MRLRMIWRGHHPTVKRLHGEYPDGVRVSAKEKKEVESRLERSKTFPKYDITMSLSENSSPKSTSPCH